MPGFDPSELKTFLVILTGGIASGKSQVSKLFSEYGVPVLDADIVARTLLEKNSPLLTELEHEFGKSVFFEDGNVNRNKLRQIIFSDDAKRQALENLLHPRIFAELMHQLDDIDSPYCLMVVPLLTETGNRYPAHRVLVVDCEEKLQFERLLKRDHLTEELAHRILAAQSGRAQRLSLADDVIENNGSLSLVSDQVRQLHLKYLEMARKLGYLPNQ